MEVKWQKSRHEIDPEIIEEAKKHGKVKIRKGKSAHQKAKYIAQRYKIGTYDDYADFNANDLD